MYDSRSEMSLYFVEVGSPDVRSEERSRVRSRKVELLKDGIYPKGRQYVTARISSTPTNAASKQVPKNIVTTRYDDVPLIVI